MFCSSCGKKIDDDAVFCSECGTKVKPMPEINASPPVNKISLEKPPVSDVPELEKPYTPENNSQPEFAPENQQETTPEIPENDKSFFGSTEPISHINPEPAPEIKEELHEKHTREPLPELVLRKKAETPKEEFPEENYQLEDYTENNNSYNDNSETQYIPYEEINNYRNNYNPPPEYENNPPYNPPPPYDEYDGQQPYPAPPPPPPPVQEYRPVKVGAFRLFCAGFITLITIIFLVVLSMLFCVKLGFSGTVLEKGIKNLNAEKILESEYDGTHDVNEFLYEKTGFYNISNHTANENDFRNFILNLDMMDFIGENVSVYADYLLNSGKKPSLTSEYIAEYMFNKSGYNNLNRNDFSTMMYNLGDGQTDEFLSVDAWRSHTGFDFRLTSYIFSFITLGVLLAVVLILMILIDLIVDRRGRHFTGFYKNIFMISGIVLLIIGSVCVIVPPIVYSQTSHVLFYLGSKLLKDFNLFILATGAFELIVGIIFGLIKKLIIRHERKNRDG
ncbi:MAG: zinc-ribbon domain-containing protein [Ruminococcus flavefaciens]|nr:zinc-ribbon domain-containing protein [Ruminococcus flavefaciens]